MCMFRGFWDVLFMIMKKNFWKKEILNLLRYNKFVESVGIIFYFN